MSAEGTPAQQKLLALTHAMLESAREGDWVAVAAKDDERQRLLAEGAADGAEAAVLHELLFLNDQLVAQASTARDEVTHSTTALQAGRRAVNAYTENER